jgi:predicted deacylase
MSFDKISQLLTGDTPGRSTELTWFRIGPQNAAKKVYLQAALHADEQPGILILHHLLRLLRAADAAGELEAQFVLFPMVNPLGMGDIEFGQHQGRYNRGTGVNHNWLIRSAWATSSSVNTRAVTIAAPGSTTIRGTGVNHNRGWPVLYDALGAGLLNRLGPDPVENVSIVRAALNEWVETLPEITAFEQWRQCVMREACSADFVFDLHCDNDSLMHIFSIPQLQQNMQRLADRIGAAATMLAEDSGGGSFDEVWPALWLRLARECPDKPLPLPVVSCTLEYRGKFDTFDALNRQDAENLYGYFQEEGLVTGKPIGNKSNAPAPTDLRATEYLRAPQAGLLAYCVELGDEVSKGDRIADLLLLDGDDAFVERIPLLAGTTGRVISRATTKYVWRNANIAKIVGSEILESRGDYLLSD